MLNIVISAAVGLLTGIISGFGIGGGTILMVYLTAVVGIAQRTAQGINLLYFLPTAAASLLIHSKNNYVNWKAVIPAVLCGCITAAALSLIAINMNLSLLKKLFGGFLIITGLLELFKKTDRTQPKKRR